MRERRVTQAGYSIIELMVVVAMVGIVTLVTVPAFVQLMPQYRIRGATSEGAATFRNVRQLAISSRRPWKITFVPPKAQPDWPDEHWYYFSRLNANGADMTDEDNWEWMGRDLRPLGTRPFGSAVNRIPGGIEVDLDTGKPLHDVDCDDYIDLVYLRNGAVSTLPNCGGNPVTDALDFELDEPDEVLPSFALKIDNDFVRFNTYTFEVTEPGILTIVGSKE